MTAVLGRGAVRGFLLFGVIAMLASTVVMVRLVARRALLGSSGSAPDQGVVVQGPLTHGLAVWNEADQSIDLTLSSTPLVCDGNADIFEARSADPTAALLKVHVPPRAPLSAPVKVTTSHADGDCPAPCRETVNREASTLVLDEVHPVVGGRVRGTATIDTDYHVDGTPRSRRGGGRFDVPVCTYQGPRWLRRLGTWFGTS